MKNFNTTTVKFTDSSNELLNSYLRDVRRFKLLTPEQEAELARTIKKGGKEAEDARKRLVEANLRFVISVAKEYSSDRLELLDLISEGNYGILKAVENYDETKGFKFISYAVWHIRQAIIKALEDHNNFSRLPHNKLSLLNKYRKMQNDILQKEQRTITADEFCVISGTDYDDFVKLLEASSNPESGDEKRFEDESDGCMWETIKSDSVTDSHLDSESLHIDITRILDTLLTDREKFIVKKFFGFDCESEKIGDIAKEMGLSHERTRQMYNKALDKIRESGVASHLTMYLAA